MTRRPTTGKSSKSARGDEKAGNYDRFKPVDNPTADQITKQVLDFLDNQGYAAWRQANEGRYDPERQQWYPHPNARRGVPDIIGFRRSDGVFIGVEVKAGTDRLRDEQIKFLDELKAAGGLSFVAYSFEQFRASFERRGLALASIAESDERRATAEPAGQPGATAADKTTEDDVTDKQLIQAIRRYGREELRARLQQIENDLQSDQ